MAPLPASLVNRRRHCAGVINALAPLLCRFGLVNIAVLASLQLSRCASSPSQRWRHRRFYDGPVVADAAMSSSPTLTWSLCRR